MSNKLRAVLAKSSSAEDLRKAMAERTGTINLDGKTYRLTTKPQRLTLVPDQLKESS